MVLPARSVSEPPSAIVLGRYNYFSDNYWIVYNRTVQQLQNEGYDVSGNASWLANANYTRLNNTFKTKIVSLSWPNLATQGVEGSHDLNVTAYRVLDDGSLGERLGSFLRTNQPIYVHSFLVDAEDPDLGVGFDPSEFTVGNSFQTRLLTYTVQRTEILTGTPWGQNSTYVLYGAFANATLSLDWTTWCDAESGLFLKVKIDTKTSTYTAHEEQNLIETGVEANKFDVAISGQSYQVHIDTNSTLDGFVFDPDTNRMNFTVEGATGTSGILNVTVPKSLVPVGCGFDVLVDGQAASYTMVEDASNYYLGVSYNHSTHTITIGFVATALWNQWWFWPTIGAIIVVIMIMAYFFLKRRTKETPNSK
jgi:hypothetical protein